MKTFLLWILAFVITISAAIYQRKTGPTYPKRYTVSANGIDYRLKLIRSLALDDDPFVRLNINDSTVRAKIYYKRYLSKDELQVADFQFESKPIHSLIMNKVFHVFKQEDFFAEVPQQPAAGKVEYYFEITDRSGTTTYLKETPVVIRFKGGVPLFILLPHILFMFIAMLFSTLSGLMAAFSVSAFRKFSWLTFGALMIGGMCLGPVVQLYAFGDLWTGIPFGWDLTDNKTLIAFVFWLLAVVMNRKKERPIYTILAAVVLLLIYSIPHSMFGSQLDYNTGSVTQGMIMNFF
ncbi:MAG: hypothetical protein Q8N05_15545 [Bacteroidota bacterium]|nr:hypothetical protein [Bacteroidota bacterium]